MTITLSTKNLVQFLLFVAVFFAVMSVALIVDASNIPAVPSHGVTMTVETIQIDTTVEDELEMFELADVPDGMASWYGRQFHGRRTASGRRFDMHELTAAHRSLPFGSLVQVENTRTGKVIMVEITDRGPFIRRRVIDLSYAAARELGVTVTPVKLAALTPEAIRAFYVDNDSTVLVIDGEQNIQVQNVSDFMTPTHEATGFTAAMMEREDFESLIIRPTERSLNFQRVQPTSDIATSVH